MVTRVSFIAHGGTVQGVGFRYFAQKRANEYGLTGWCRNTTNNKVEGAVQGEDEAVGKFLKDVEEGPRHAKVVQLSREEQDCEEGESGFDIRH